jgi:hypothetical protein
VGHVQSRFLTRLEIQGDIPNELGLTPKGKRRVVYIKGGTFAGPELSGEIAPGGGDAALIRHDGVFEADVRLLLRCHGGDMIHVTYRGIWHGTVDVMSKLLAREEAVDPAQYYFRTAVFFETGASKYAWLNKILAIGYGLPQPRNVGGGIAYDIYEIL